jgi:TRAP-type C4-dicarboxylate transport system permease small subunit
LLTPSITRLATLLYAHVSHLTPHLSLRKILHKVLDGFGVVSAAFVFAIFVVMLGAALLRTAGMKTGGSDDIVSWLTAAAAFFGLAHTFRHGDFVRMGLVIEKLKPSTRRVVEIVALVIGVVFTGYLFASVAAYVWDSYKFGDVADGLVPIKKWIPQMSIVIGTFLLFLACVDELIHLLRGGVPSYISAVEERHARGDFSEDV